MIVEYLNELKRNPKQKSMVFARVQLFLNNDGIKSEANYQLVKKQLLPFVRGEQGRTDFSEMLIWLFMQNAQYKMALIQAKALDKRTSADGEEVYDLAESFLDKKAIIKKDKYTIPKDLRLDFKFRSCFVDIIKAAKIQN